MYSRHVAVVRDDSEILTLNDLTGKNVAVMSSTKPEGIFRRVCSDITKNVLQISSIVFKHFTDHHVKPQWANIATMSKKQTCIIQMPKKPPLFSQYFYL